MDFSLRVEEEEDFEGCFKTSYRRTTDDLYTKLKKIILEEKKLPKYLLILATIYHFFNHFIESDYETLKSIFLDSDRVSFNFVDVK